MLINLNFKHLVSLIFGITALLLLILGISTQKMNSAFDSITRSWHQIDTASLHRAELLISIESDLGYGGMIHNFKDAVLRRDHEFVHRAETALENVLISIRLYEKLNPGKAEMEALKQLQGVLAHYKQGLPIVHNAAKNNVSIRKLDQKIKVDDTPAVTALETLRRSIYTGDEDNPGLKKWLMIVKLRQLLGYGGMIHLYKNTVLRGVSDERSAVMAKKFRQINITLNALSLEANMGENEALEMVRSTVGKYQVQYARIKKLFAPGLSIHMLNNAVSVDDRAMLTGLGMLEKRLDSEWGIQKLKFGKVLSQVNIDIHFYHNMLFILLISFCMIGIYIVYRIFAQPFFKLTNAFNQLSAENTDVKIPGLELQNEVGDLARAADAFRVSLIERKGARAWQAQIASISKDTFDNSEDAVLLLKGAQFIDCNPSGIKMLNAKNKDQVFDIQPADISPEYQPDGQLSADKAQEMIALAHENNFHRFEWVHKTLNGKEFLCEVTLTKVIVGDEVMLHVVWRDVTERKSVEELLRDREERFDLAVKGSNIGIWDWKSGSREIVYSPGVEEILGRKMEQTTENERFFLDALCPEYKGLFLRAFREYIRGDSRRFEFEGRITNKDGNLGWVRILAQAIRDEDGFVTRVVGSMIDITRQKRVEETLLNHQEHLEELVQERTGEVAASHSLLVSAINSIEASFILFDSDGVVKLVNNQFAYLYSLPRDACRPDTSLDDLLSHFTSFISDKELKRRKKEILNAKPEDLQSLPDGRTMRISRSRTEQGDILAVITDVSDFIYQENLLKEQARELEKALSLEKELNELQRQFVSMASHEFRTPLAIIDSCAQRLGRRADNLDPQDVLNRVENIRGAVKRMVKLMESTLSIACMDAGKLKINVTDCDLRAVVLEVMQRQIEMAEGSKITCDLKALPEKIVGDSASLDQVFTNLLSNAVKYSPGIPEIHVRGWCEGADILVSVRDNGFGIDEDDLPKMFKRFFRAKTSSGIAGTGIGLNLVKMIVEEHNGTVSIDSKNGKGSTFTVRLPMGDMTHIPENGTSIESRDAA